MELNKINRLLNKKKYKLAELKTRYHFEVTNGYNRRKIKDLLWNEIDIMKADIEALESKRAECVINKII